MLIPNYFEDLAIHHVNTLPRRNYFIPYESMQKAKESKNRRDSANYEDLNGTWQFHYFPNVRTIDQPYWLGEHASSLPYEEMTVPSCWQLSGHDQIMYTNTEFPIPYDPPYVPYDNPAGLYKRTIELPEIEEHAAYHLNFEGVDSAFYVWVNDQFIGYSQISHSINEFDISDALQKGTNNLSVLVLKWSVGTYFEDQDKFRYSGIFRDVYMIKRQAKRLDHFNIQTTLSEDLGEAHISFTATKHQNIDSFVYHLYDPDGLLVESSVAPVGQAVEIAIRSPKLWHAEEPLLYQLVIEAGDECYRQNVGIRTVEIKNNQLYINHKSIKLIGVNHHDTHPETGATVTLENQRNDLKLMKQYNFNAIRTAHYPKTAEFYELCDQIGFYVLTEADIECHGVVDLYGVGGYGNYNMIADDPTFEETFVNRMDASMVPFMNFTSIIMWSGGNESGYGCNIVAMLRHARELDGKRPLHYESYWARDREKEFDDQFIDMWSRMYPSIEEIETVYFSKPLDRPFILCEYIHAMGNGPGDIDNYYKCMERHPEFIGAFVWEWADHSVDLNRGTGKEPAYRYGGDFGEFPHSGNFCMDGLVYPDRTPHTGLYEHRQIFRPVRLSSYVLGENDYTFSNRYDFSRLDMKIALSAELYDLAGRKMETVSLATPPIEPKEEMTVPFDFLNEGNRNEVGAVRFVYTMAGTDIELGFDHIEVQAFQPKLELLNERSPLSCNETFAHYEVSVPNGQLVISKGNGAVAQIVSDGKELLEKPAYWTIWRSPVDNDRRIKKEWFAANYDRTSTRVHQQKVAETENGITITMDAVLNSVARQNILEFTIEWMIENSGKVNLTVQAKKNKAFPFLPRFGMCLPLIQQMDSVVYYGNGPYESYPDKQHANYLAHFEGHLTDLYEPYVTPQENGSRNGVKQLTVKGGASDLTFISEEGMSFNLSHFSTEQLTAVKHRDLLEAEPMNYLHLDYQHSGMGSNACGPELDQEFRLDGPAFTFSTSFTI